MEDAARYLTPAMRNATKIYRVKATFGHPLIFAEYLALCMPFLIHFAMTGYNCAVRIVSAAAIPFLIYVILLTNSRLGVVGVFISFAVYFLLWAVMKMRQHRHSLIAATIVLSYPVAFVGAVASTFLVRPSR